MQKTAKTTPKRKAATKTATASTRKATTRKPSSRKTSTRKTSSRAASTRKTSTRKAKAAETVKRLDPNNYGDLTRVLGEQLTTRAPVSYDRGRTRMSEKLVDALECTPTRARHIVSSLVQRGFVRFGPHPDYQHDRTVGRWTYHPAGK